MQTFVDVLIYAGKNKVATVCVLDLLKSPLLRKLFDSLNICDVCNGGKLSIIFPNEDEDESTLRDVFNWFSLVPETRLPSIEGQLLIIILIKRDLNLSTGSDPVKVSCLLNRLECADHPARIKSAIEVSNEQAVTLEQPFKIEYDYIEGKLFNKSEGCEGLYIIRSTHRRYVN